MIDMYLVFRLSLKYLCTYNILHILQLKFVYILYFPFVSDYLIDNSQILMKYVFHSLLFISIFFFFIRVCSANTFCINLPLMSVAVFYNWIMWSEMWLSFKNIQVYLKKKNKASDKQLMKLINSVVCFPLWLFVFISTLIYLKEEYQFKYLADICICSKCEKV